MRPSPRDEKAHHRPARVSAPYPFANFSCSSDWTRARRGLRHVRNAEYRFLAPLSMPGIIFLGIEREKAEKDLLKHREALLERLLGRMSDENATAFLALDNRRTHASPHVLHGIRETNTSVIIASEMRPAIPGFSADSVFALEGTCAVLSRISHSCRPNAVISFDISSFSFGLRVVRDVPANSQLTVSYVDLSLHRSAEGRQEVLSSWNFACMCSSCSFPEVTDARREEIAASEIDPEAVGKALMNISQPVDYLIERSLRILHLIAEEGLQSDRLYRQHLVVLGLAYASLGDREGYLRAYAKISEFHLSKAEMEERTAEDELIWTFYPVPEHYAFWNMRLRIKAHEQGK